MVEDAISAFIADLETLFSIYPDNGYGQFIYFPPEFRAPIMQAGRTQTLLRICYKGQDRIIEPYSLKYLQRKDGQQREYFYAYNCSGGDNNPGIRCLVPENIQSIENTNEKFEPRFLIELSKAGEMPENRYLFDPNKPLKVPRRRIGGTHFRGVNTIKYVFKCSICGKQFTRTTYDSHINPHKSKKGFQCYGTFGIYVSTKYN